MLPRPAAPRVRLEQNHKLQAVEMVCTNRKITNAQNDFHTVIDSAEWSPMERCQGEPGPLHSDRRGTDAGPCLIVYVYYNVIL